MLGCTLGGGLWIALCVFDNLVRMCQILEVPSFIPAALLAGFDRGMYVLGGRASRTHFFSWHFMPDTS